MKKKFLKIMAGAFLLVGVGATATASPDLKEILSAGGGAIGGLVEGIFTTSDLTINDIAGEWTSEGSAVSFKSENFLKKAGGAAAAGAVESQLDPYFKKYGLTGAVLRIDKSGNFSLTIKKISLKGVLTNKSKGVFVAKFTAFGSMSLGSMDTYIEKSGNSLNVMFDADKIKSIISFAATISGNKMASTADKVLQQYDGICVGFQMKKTGEAPSTSGSGNGANTTQKDNSGESTTDAAINALKGLFGN